MTSYEDATLENTLPTSDSFNDDGTSLKPKCVVESSFGGGGLGGGVELWEANEGEHEKSRVREEDATVVCWIDLDPASAAALVRVPSMMAKGIWLVDVLLCKVEEV